MCIAYKIESRPLTSSYPSGWQNAASSIKDYPLREIKGRNFHIIDPWQYIDRLGVFKIMVISTESYFQTWGFNNTGNLLWGLPLQFSWQLTSGRLQVQTHPAKSRSVRSMKFSPASWWADMNYFLSIIPFLGAVNAGLVTSSKYSFHILLPTNVTVEVRDKFCTSVTQCQSRHPNLMKRWTEFFAYLSTKGMAKNGHDMDVTVGLLWDAHTTSIRTGN